MTIEEKLDYIIQLLEKRKYTKKSLPEDSEIKTKIESCFDWRKGISDWKPMTCKEILNIIGRKGESREELNECGNALRVITGSSWKKSTKGRRVWMMPPEMI